MEAGAGKLVRGALSLTLAALIVKVIGVLYKVPMSYILGEEGMGYFNSAYSIYGFFYIITSSGIPRAITLNIVKLKDEYSSLAIISLYKRMLFVFGGCGFAITVLVLLFSGPLSDILAAAGSHSPLIAISPCIFFVTLSGVAKGYLNAYERFGTIAVSQLIEALGKLILGLSFAYIGLKLSLSLSIISAFTILGITLGSFVSMCYLLKSANMHNTDDNTGQRTTLSIKYAISQVAKTAIPITASSALAALSGVLDLALIMVGLRSIGFDETTANSLYGSYSTYAYPMISLTTALLSPIMASILPRLTEASLKRNTEDFNNAFSFAALLTALISVPAAMIFLLYPFDVLDILFTSSGALGASSMLAFMAPTALILPALTLLNTALEAVGKPSFALASMCASLMIKVLLVIILLPNYGVLSIPIATASSDLLAFIISFILLKRTYRPLKPAKKICALIVVGLFIYSLSYLGSIYFGLYRGDQISTVLLILISSITYLIPASSLVCGCFTSPQKNILHKKKNTIQHLER